MKKRNNLLIKMIVCSTIVLFAGASVVPSINGRTATSFTTSKSAISVAKNLNNGDDGSNKFLDNNPPEIPATPNGPTVGFRGLLYTYTTSTIDPDGDQVYYRWSWGDGTFSDWLGPYNSGEEIHVPHDWSVGNYIVKVKARDIHGAITCWSEPLHVQISELGDADHDYDIDLSDLALLLSIYQTADDTADFTGEGMTDGMDLGILLAYYGYSY